MKKTTQQTFNRTKTALAVGVALFAVSELALAVYETHDSGITATADTAEVDDEAITIDVLANDAEANASTLAIGTQPTQGTVSISAGQVVYTPNEGFSGTDTFTYTVEENEWRKDEAGAFTVTPYSLTVNSTTPIANSYTATLTDGSTISVPINDGTFPDVGYWNDADKGDGVIGKSWKPSSSLSQLQGCNNGDELATPISLAMTWSAERKASATFGTGSNQFTITTNTAPSPGTTEADASNGITENNDGIVLRKSSVTTDNIVSSNTGATGTFTETSGDILTGTNDWKFTTTTNWSNLTAAEFEALPITVIASTYNGKLWYSQGTTFDATVDYSTCTLKTATATVTITAKESSGGGGGGSMDKVALFALGLFGLNVLRRRRQA